MTLKKPMPLIAAVVSALIALIVLSACAVQPANDASSGQRSVPADGESVSEAMVLDVHGGQALFVDTDTQTVYYPTLPPQETYGLNGERMSPDDLKPGNIVRVCGNGIMLESYPGQYPGIARVEVIAAGDPADVEPYADVIEMVMAANDDLWGLPSGSVHYRTDLADVSMALEPLAADWATDDGIEPLGDVLSAALTPEGTIKPELGDARITEPTDAEVAFTSPSAHLSVWCSPLVATDDAYRLAEGAVAERVSTTSVPDDTETGAPRFAFRIAPGFLYVLQADFSDGTVQYAFIAL